MKPLNSLGRKHSLSLCLVTMFSSLTLLLTAPSQSLAEFDPPRVVKILSRMTCASGFLDERSRLLTNAHVLQGLCGLRDCTEVPIARKGAGEETLSVHQLTGSSALDIAQFQLERPPVPRPELTVREPKVGETVTLIGFPGCGEREERQATIVALTPLDIVLDGGVAHGMSGGPVLGRDGAMLGILRQIEGVGGAIGSQVFGGGVAGRATRLDVFRQAETSSQGLTNALLPLVKAAALNELRDSAATLLAQTRAQALASGFELDLMLNGELTQAKGLTMRRSGELRGFARSLDDDSIPADLRALNIIAFAAQLGSHSLEELPSTANDRFTPLIEELRELHLRPYPIEAAAMVLPWVLGAVVFCFLMAAGGGFVFAETTGNMLRRIGIAMLAGLLWPIALPLFLVKGREYGIRR